MKAILLMNEVPETCSDCPCYNSKWHECNADPALRGIGAAKVEKIPDWCPLTMVPDEWALDFDRIIE